MSKFAFYFVSFLVLCLFGNYINCECRFQILQNGFVNPVFGWTIGEKTLKISNPNFDKEITLKESEEVDGSCITKFSPIQYYGGYLEDSLEISLKCFRNSLYIWNGEEYIHTSVVKFVCNDYDWAFYESMKPFPWCSSIAESYVFVAGPMQTVFGALCYNFQNLSLESIRYLASSENFKFEEENLLMQTPVELENIKLGTEFTNFQTILSNHKLFQKTIKNEDFFGVAVYKDEVLLQGQDGGDIFSEYSNFLNIKWWHNLLHGNWKKFTKAFKEQTDDVTYDVFMGISGAVRVPYSDCHGTEFREIQFIENNGSIPEYIWLYLRAVNIDEEFLFVGYNSPYYDFSDTSKIVFCKDICDEIPWLKNVRSTFHYWALGITFCCRPDDVRNSTILNGFPKKYKPDVYADVSKRKRKSKATLHKTQVNNSQI